MHNILIGNGMFVTLLGSIVFNYIPFNFIKKDRSVTRIQHAEEN